MGRLSYSGAVITQISQTTEVSQIPSYKRSHWSFPALSSQHQITDSLTGQSQQITGEKLLTKYPEKEGKKERPKTERKNTPSPDTVVEELPPSCAQTMKPKKRSTGQRKLHKSSTAFSLAQGQLSSCVGVKRNKGLFTDFDAQRWGSN